MLALSLEYGEIKPCCDGKRSGFCNSDKTESRTSSTVDGITEDRVEDQAGKIEGNSQ